MGVAGAPIAAGEIVTWTRAHRAVLAREAQGAPTGEVVDAIHARASIAAGVACTVIDVGLTTSTGEAGPTPAHESVTKVQTLCTCRVEEKSG